MSLKDKTPIYGTTEWRAYQYQRRLEEQRGHNYQNFNQEKWDKLEQNGWQMHVFSGRGTEHNATMSEMSAKEVVEEYRKTGHYSRIITGYSQNKQRIKMFTVIYKKK